VRPVKQLVAALAVCFIALLVVTGASAQDEKVVFTVGIANDWDSINPLVGVEVGDYELWNIQYATLTDKAAADFSTVPGLAESWEGSEDGKTWTYTLREGLTWSDGEPLTAEDIAFTVNRAREEEWLNYDSVVQNLTAEARDERTVVITSSVADPKLPTMDVYILPEHIWGKLDDKAITKYDALDGVGSGPFVLDEWKRGQYIRTKANPSYWGGEPAVDEVIFRLFNNADAMVAALRTGEIDAAHDVPSAAFKDFETDEDFVAVQGYQGGFEELAINAGDGVKDPHPALLDLKVRQAVAHAIDRETLIEKVLVGLAQPGEVMSPSASLAWIPEIPAEESFDFDLEQANQILDDAGYADSDGDGVREMPGGGQQLSFVYALRTESQDGAQVAEYITGWLKEIGIATTIKPMNDSKLIEVIGAGDYDMFHWGWTPFVDPDPMLSYFQCDQIAPPGEPTNYYNDANWCDQEYDRLYKEQNQELDPDRRRELVAEMLRRFHDAAVYNILYLNPDLQVYRTGRFDGWTKQPAESGDPPVGGPVLFSNTSPTYAKLTPAAAGSDDGGGGLGTGVIVVIAVAAAAALGLVAFLLVRRRSAEERE
jgi:peptide/nickel transport system substrate-binding protein